MKRKEKKFKGFGCIKNQFLEIQYLYKKEISKTNIEMSILEI